MEIKKKLNNPVYVGPGAWYSIHLKAKKATTDKKINEFIDYMYDLAEEFPCKKCRVHINEYLNKHSFDPFRNLTNDKGENIGMFKWAWMFHNSVNSRLGKLYVDWDTAWEMYDNAVDKICSDDCDDSLVSLSERNNFDKITLVEQSMDDDVDDSYSSDSNETIINSMDFRKRVVKGFFESSHFHRPIHI